MTCIGLAGVLGVRAAEDSTAADSGSQPTGESVTAGGTQATTSAGLSQAELQAYAQQLDDEAQRLADYRQQLIQVAAELQAVAEGQGLQVRSTGGNASTPVRKPKPRPANQPPVSQPQGQSQGS
jgi:hypothetical protein